MQHQSLSQIPTVGYVPHWEKFWDNTRKHSGESVTCSNSYPASRLPVWHYQLGLSGAQFPHLYSECDGHLLPFLPGPLSRKDWVSPPSRDPTCRRLQQSHCFSWPFPSAAAGCSLPLGVPNWNRENGLLSYWMCDVEAWDSCDATMFVVVGCRAGERERGRERERRRRERERQAWSTQWDAQRRAEMVQQGENALSFVGCILRPSLKSADLSPGLHETLVCLHNNPTPFSGI